MVSQVLEKKIQHINARVTGGQPLSPEQKQEICKKRYDYFIFKIFNDVTKSCGEVYLDISEYIIQNNILSKESITFEKVFPNNESFKEQERIKKYAEGFINAIFNRDIKCLESGYRTGKMEETVNKLYNIIQENKKKKEEEEKEIEDLRKSINTVEGIIKEINQDKKDDPLRLFNTLKSHISKLKDREKKFFINHLFKNIKNEIYSKLNSQHQINSSSASTSSSRSSPSENYSKLAKDILEKYSDFLEKEDKLELAKALITFSCKKLEIEKELLKIYGLEIDFRDMKSFINYFLDQHRSRDNHSSQLQDLHIPFIDYIKHIFSLFKPFANNNNLNSYMSEVISQQIVSYYESLSRQGSSFKEDCKNAENEIQLLKNEISEKDRKNTIQRVVNSIFHGAKLSFQAEKLWLQAFQEEFEEPAYKKIVKSFIDDAYLNSQSSAFSVSKAHNLLMDNKCWLIKEYPDFYKQKIKDLFFLLKNSTKSWETSILSEFLVKNSEFVDFEELSEIYNQPGLFNKFPDIASVIKNYLNKNKVSTLNSNKKPEPKVSFSVSQVLQDNISSVALKQIKNLLKIKDIPVELTFENSLRILEKEIRNLRPEEQFKAHSALFTLKTVSSQFQTALPYIVAFLNAEDDNFPEFSLNRSERWSLWLTESLVASTESSGQVTSVTCLSSQYERLFAPLTGVHPLFNYLFSLENLRKYYQSKTSNILILEVKNILVSMAVRKKIKNGENFIEEIKQLLIKILKTKIKMEVDKSISRARQESLKFSLALTTQIDNWVKNKMREFIDKKIKEIEVAVDYLDEIEFSSTSATGKIEMENLLEYIKRKCELFRNKNFT